MKKFKVKRSNKTYIVQAKDAMHATKLADAATQLATINALVTDEQAAIAAYNVAIENLNGVVDPKYIEVLRSIVKEENKHIENLQAIITGNVTEKNVEDSVKDSFYAIRTRNNGRVGEWYVKADSEQKAFDVVKRQPGHQFDEFVSIKQVDENELNRVGARVIS